MRLVFRLAAAERRDDFNCQTAAAGKKQKASATAQAHAPAAPPRFEKAFSISPLSIPRRRA
jgi:hypothetical protein